MELQILDLVMLNLLQRQGFLGGHLSLIWLVLLLLLLLVLVMMTSTTVMMTTIASLLVCG